MPTLDPQEFQGFRVLILEDDFLAARSLRNMVADLGCAVVGPASNAEQACAMIKNDRVQAAILDINLSPGTCEPVARALRYQSIPFVFITGYSNIHVLPDDLRGQRVLTKPVDRATITSAIEHLVNECSTD